MHPLPYNAGLLVIDVQNGFDEPGWGGSRNNPRMEDHIARLQDAWRATGRVLIHVQHDSRWPGSPLYPGKPGHAIKPAVRPLPGEPVIRKSVNSAFIGTGLEVMLRQCGVATLVLTGLQTDHCVSTTARMAANLGFKTYVVSDATATVDRTGPDGRHHQAEDVHSVALAELNGEFATIIDTQAVLEGLREPPLLAGKEPHGERESRREVPALR
jgi:nicotinamidase-related amidase